MFGNLSGPTLLVILFIVLLLFGAPKLPALARSLGQSMKILKKEVSGTDEETPAATAPAAQPAAPVAQPAAPAAPATPVAQPAPEAPAAQPVAPVQPDVNPDGTAK